MITNDQQIYGNSKPKPNPKPPHLRFSLKPHHMVSPLKPAQTKGSSTLGQGSSATTPPLDHLRNFPGARATFPDIPHIYEEPVNREVNPVAPLPPPRLTLNSMEQNCPSRDPHIPTGPAPSLPSLPRPPVRTQNTQSVGTEKFIATCKSSACGHYRGETKPRQKIGICTWGVFITANVFIFLLAFIVCIVNASSLEPKDSSYLVVYGAIFLSLTVGLVVFCTGVTKDVVHRCQKEEHCKGDIATFYRHKACAQMLQPYFEQLWT